MDHRGAHEEWAIAPIEADDVVTPEHRQRLHREVGRGDPPLTLPPRLIAGLAASVSGHLSLLVLMFFVVPPSSTGLALDRRVREGRLVAYLERAGERPDEQPGRSDADEGAAGSTSAPSGDEGERGDPREARTDRRAAFRWPARRPSPAPGREVRMAQAQNAGAIAALRGFLAAAGPTSPAPVAAGGQHAFAALGALVGDRPGASDGVGGLSMRGVGVGTGDGATGTIGLDGFHTIGGRDGPGGRGGYGRGVGRITCGEDGERCGHRVPRLLCPERDPRCRAEVRGSLSGEAVRRVVRRHLNEVRFCYEQALQTRPDLEGRGVVSWVVGPSGAVQRASVASSTLRNAAVEQCIANAVRRWTFPAPSGGGVAGINYPFRLQTAGRP
ncbi:MAG: AgmX/PglI C-terminal domain-containing protein [Sandaracinaceae bacterium]